MKTKHLKSSVTAVAVLAMLVTPITTSAQQFTTPDSVETRLGTLKFKDGVPDAAATQKLYDELDYIHAVGAFMNGYPLVNQLALRKGFIKAGINDNEFIVTPNLMEAKSLFLTANADTYYFWGYIDLTKGPMVVETPPGALGIFDDMTWKWITDFGLPGPDRGEGGKYLIVPPGYNGTLPEGGYFVGHSGTWQVSCLGRLFLQDNDPKPVDEIVKKIAQDISLCARRHGLEHRQLFERKRRAGTTKHSGLPEDGRWYCKGDEHHSTCGLHIF